MELVKELLALREGVEHKFQVRIDANYAHNDPAGKGRLHGGTWKEITFKSISSLEALADEIGDDGHDGKKIFKALPELHGYLESYHLGYDRSDVFDVVDEDYDIKSFKDDVLKVSYKFTVRYKKDHKDPVTHRGEITFME